MSHSESFRYLLQSVFVSKLRKNSQYSMRAFAKSLGLDQSHLSKILAGKSSLTLNTALKLAPHLDMNTEQVRSHYEDDVKVHSIEEDTFSVISEWIHFAILEMVNLEGFSNDSLWISKRLGVKKVEVDEAINRLERLEFIKLSAGKIELSRKNNNWVNSQNTSTARINLQIGLLKRAIIALNEVDFGERDNSSLTVAIDQSELSKYSEEIKSFRKKINRISSRTKKSDQVYQLCIAFYPVTKNEERK